MGKGTQMAVGLATWVSIALDVMGWILLLSGVASMQNKCGGADANLFLTGGASGYNGPVSCDVFFAYPWWITFYNLTAIGISIAALLGFMQRFRPGVMALLSISLMQNLDTANTFLFYNDVETTSGSFNASARVTAAGAIIKSISMFFLLGLIGTRDESVTQYERPAKQKSKAAAPAERV